ncbi:MAG: helix-turn-helix domain-containing protein [Oligosphaeraceae bacterium]|nr:helix-turn-helix domain-containing protein [Oligosphaeraceae bacterium]
MKEEDVDITLRAPVQALRKGLSILELISFAPDGAGLSLSEISVQMGLKRSTAHNLLKTLCLCGYAENSGSGIYRGGWKLRQFGRALSLSGYHSGLFRSVLGSLAARTGEAVVFATLLNGRRRVVARASGGQEIQVDLIRLEPESMSIWSTVTGKILAACCSAPELALICQHYGLPDSDSWPGIGRLQELQAALGQIRQQGLSCNFTAQVCSAAVPVYTGRQQLLGALGIHFPQFRHKPAADQAMFALLRQGAAELSAALETPTAEELATAAAPAAEDSRRNSD